MLNLNFVFKICLSCKEQESHYDHLLSFAEQEVIIQFLRRSFCSRRKYSVQQFLHKYWTCTKMMLMIAKLCLYLLKVFPQFTKQEITFSFHLVSEVPQFFKIRFQICHDHIVKPQRNRSAKNFNQDNSHHLAVQKSVCILQYCMCIVHSKILSRSIVEK